jgi:hypothetical protein
MTTYAKKDVQTRFHEEWLGLAQPYEGLTFSVPVLSDAQVMPEVGPELPARFKAALTLDEAEGALCFGDLFAFFEGFLGYDTPSMLARRAELPPELHFYAEEGRQDIRPSFAIMRGPFAPDADDPFAVLSQKVEPASTDDAPTKQPWALVWDVRDDAGAESLGLDLDKPEERTGSWRYPSTQKLERLLRHTGVAVGLLCNGRDLRLVYAPPGESTSHLTFRSADMQEAAGRPLLAAFELLLHRRRAYEAAADFTLEGLLRQSRLRQADVTKDLAEQVFEAVEILLEGFEHAAARDTGAGRHDWLRAALEEDGDHLYQGVLSVVLRLVFLLYAEDQGLLPTGHATYAQHLSVQGLYDALVDDAGMHPESMHHRYGAYGRLVSLFRAIYLGVEHGELRLPPRRGKLFDPSSFPFLEGSLPGSTAAIVSPEARASVHLPSLDDGTVHAVLHRLIVFEGQRLSYRALDVEQIGSIYESLMGFHVLRVESPAVRLGGNRVWIETAALRAQKPSERAKWLKEACGLSKAQLDKVETALKERTDDASLAEALNELSPGKKHEKLRHRVPRGKLVLQPGEERRRSGSHYTPRSLTERIVRRTLEPLLKCLGEAPTEAQLLSLKICDPAMGSGAFLVEVTRQLADQLVIAWTREGKVAGIAEEHGDAHLHGRRLAAQRCVYGVDKNPAAVELAKLSLWLVTLSRELPFTFVDHNLRHGDSLVGLDLTQISSFHWKPTKQVPLFKQVLEESLDEALEHRGELLELAQHEDARSQEHKRRLLDYAEHATERIRLVADVCVGAFFAEAKDKAREIERTRRQKLVEQWLDGDDSVEAELRGLAEEIRLQHAPFHWWLEFPEVFYESRPDPLCGGEVNGAACMEGFVGNPPFAGKNGVVALGDGYLDWLLMIHEGAHGNADLSAHFFRRAATLLGGHGSLGLIATNTISQGDTRSSGLQHLVTHGGFSIYDATPSTVWPGEAAVFVSVVMLSKGFARHAVRTLLLDNLAVAAISSQLRAHEERSDPRPLLANVGISYTGVRISGAGFLLTEREQSQALLADPSNASVILPYLGGEEANSDPEQAPHRYVINFGRRTLDEAATWRGLLQRVEQTVKPLRDAVRENVGKGGHGKKYWWQFVDRCDPLYDALTRCSRCLVVANVSKHLVFSWQPTARVFSNSLCVVALDRSSAFACLQSRLHTTWAAELCATIKNDQRYNPSRAFDTFPFPQTDPRTGVPAAEAAGEALYESRARFMVDTNQGLTKTYNALKDPANTDGRVLELRRLHEAMDRAVLDAYGWTDLTVPAYCPLDDEQKAELKAFEDEVIDRLYALNAERAREEARLGLGKKAKGAKKKGKKGGDDGGGMLPGLGED